MENKKPAKKVTASLVSAGRPTLYKEELCEEIVKFFDVPPSRTVFKSKHTNKGESYIEEVEEMAPFPTLAGFAAKVGISRETINEWQKIYPEFSDAVKKCKAFQENILVQNGLSGRTNPAFTIFVAKNLIGYRNEDTVNIQPSGHAQLLDQLESGE